MSFKMDPKLNGSYSSLLWTLRLGKVLHPISMPRVFEIACNHHSDRPKTQMVGNYDDCKVEPTSGAHTGKMIE